MNGVSVTLLARDGDPACRYGFGFALEVERDDLAPVDGSDARDSLAHDDLAPRRNALEPRRGVHDVANCGEATRKATASIGLGLRQIPVGTQASEQSEQSQIADVLGDDLRRDVRNAFIRAHFRVPDRCTEPIGRCH
jgi:hypothetical protein